MRIFTWAEIQAMDDRTYQRYITERARQDALWAELDRALAANRRPRFSDQILADDPLGQAYNIALQQAVSRRRR